jgi:hypothetical protein
MRIALIRSRRQSSSESDQYEEVPRTKKRTTITTTTSRRKGEKFLCKATPGQTRLHLPTLDLTANNRTLIRRDGS